MEAKTCKIILLDDLSPKIEESFQLIRQFCSEKLLQFTILHIIDKEQEAEISKEKISLECYHQKVTQHVHEMSQKWGLDLQLRIEKGSIFETIPLIAKEERANMILFNTHGITQYQERTISNAYRLIEKSIIPIAIIHSCFQNTIEKIVTNTEDNLQQIIDFLSLNIKNIEINTDFNQQNALILYQISALSLYSKEEQKKIEKLIFNDNNVPFICWKKEVFSNYSN